MEYTYFFASFSIPSDISPASIFVSPRLLSFTPTNPVSVPASRILALLATNFAKSSNAIGGEMYP